MRFFPFHHCTNQYSTIIVVVIIILDPVEKAVLPDDNQHVPVVLGRP